MTKVIDLRALQSRIAARVVLFDDDAEHDVLAMPGDGYHKIKAAGANPDLAVLYEVAAQILPSLSPSEIGRLVPSVVGQIIEVSMTGIDDVETTDPNAVRLATDPAATPPTSPA